MPSSSPSSDIVKPPLNKTARRKKSKHGGQKGHKRKLRELLPPERVDAYIELKQAIPEQPRRGSDESSLKNNGKKHWIWCITAPLTSLTTVRGQCLKN
jgi:hypothetical protein